MLHSAGDWVGSPHRSEQRDDTHQPSKTMKTDHLTLLNEVQAFIIAQANESGMNLADHFTTVQEFKDFVVGMAFRGLRDAGADVATAFNATVGEGQYEAAFARFTA